MELDASEDFQREDSTKNSQTEVEEKTFTIESGVREQCFKITKNNESSQDRSVEKDMRISTMRQTASFLEALSVEKQLVQIFTEQV
jgi:hypothetical protein